VASGRSNGVVAEALGLSETILKFRLINIYRKIGVVDRTEAAEWARKHGIGGDGGVGVREPRRPTPPALSDAAALPLPEPAEED
jgi:hypothetical protein